MVLPQDGLVSATLELEDLFIAHSSVEVCANRALRAESVMAFSKLPIELICQVLDNFVDPVDRASQYRERQKYIASLCLVNSFFREFLQPKLCHVIKIDWRDRECWDDTMWDKVKRLIVSIRDDEELENSWIEDLAYWGSNLEIISGFLSMGLQREFYGSSNITKIHLSSVLMSSFETFRFPHLIHLEFHEIEFSTDEPFFLVSQLELPSLRHFALIPYPQPLPSAPVFDAVEAGVIERLTPQLNSICYSLTPQSARYFYCFDFHRSFQIARIEIKDVELLGMVKPHAVQIWDIAFLTATGGTGGGIEESRIQHVIELIGVLRRNARFRESLEFLYLPAYLSLPDALNVNLESTMQQLVDLCHSNRIKVYYEEPRSDHFDFWIPNELVELSSKEEEEYGSEAATGDSSISLRRTVSPESAD